MNIKKSIIRAVQMAALLSIAGIASAQTKMHDPAQFIAAYRAALKNGDFTAATNILRIEQVLVHVDVLKSYLKSGDEKAFGAYAETLVKSDFDTEPYALDQVAWLIACPDAQTNARMEAEQTGYIHLPDISPNFNRKQFLSLAQKAIDQAITLSHQRGDIFLDTLAWVQYSKGDLKAAAKTEAEAAQNATYPQIRTARGDAAKWLSKQARGGK